MKRRIAALACSIVLTSFVSADATPAAIHITGGGVGIGDCAIVLAVFPNVGPPIAAPPCLGSAYGSVVGRTPANTVVAWHSDYGGCGLLCGAYAVAVAYTDVCVVGGSVSSEAGGGAGSFTVTGEGDADGAVETLHADFAFVRAGPAISAILFAAYIDMDGDSPAGADLDSDVAIHDPTGLSGDAVGVVIPGAIPPPCAAPGPLPLTIAVTAEIRGV